MSFLAIDTFSKKLNLQFLQSSLDPMVESILHTSSHVVLYDYDLNDNVWMDTRIQGCFFVARAWTGAVKVILMNRTNRHETASVSFDIRGEDGKLVVEWKVPELGQIMLRRPGGEIHNLWFFKQTEFLEVKELFQNPTKW